MLQQQQLDIEACVKGVSEAPEKLVKLCIIMIADANEIFHHSTVRESQWFVCQIARSLFACANPLRVDIMVCIRGDSRNDIIV